MEDDNYSDGVDSDGPENGNNEAADSDAEEQMSNEDEESGSEEEDADSDEEKPKTRRSSRRPSARTPAKKKKGAAKGKKAAAKKSAPKPAAKKQPARGGRGKKAAEVKSPPVKSPVRGTRGTRGAAAKRKRSQSQDSATDTPNDKKTKVADETVEPEPELEKMEVDEPTKPEAEPEKPAELPKSEEQPMPVDEEEEKETPAKEEEKAAQSKSKTEAETTKPSKESTPPKEAESKPEEKSTSSATQKEAKKSKKRDNLPELAKYWKTVKDSPQDFTGWTYLLQYVEQDVEMTSARDAYDTFFERYPYCYGYWKKYADLEKKHGYADRCQAVFERGTKAVPLSVDFWIHYLNFYKAQHKEDEDREELVRAQFEKAIKAAGTEFRSDRLWDMYITWESDQQNLHNVTALYDRLLAIPTQLYSHHFETFQKHVNRFHPKDILSTDEFIALRKEYLKTREGEDDMPPVTPPPKEEKKEGEEAKEGEGTVEEEVTEVAVPMEVAKIAKSLENELKALREMIINQRRDIHKANEEEVSKRWAFEEGIKRPYFHVKPLERVQLKNWRDYLEFEIQNGTHERVVVLFERCMIACALYEEFWLKYARYLDNHTAEGARSVFRRACSIHLQHKPTLQLAWAAYEEKLGNFAAAKEILQKLDEKHSNYLPIMLRRINLERRQGKFEEAQALFDKYLTSLPTNLLAYLSIKYAKFCQKFLGNLEKAVEVLERAIGQEPDNATLYLQLTDIYMQQSPMDEAKITAVLQRAEDVMPDADSKMMFAQRRLEFLEDFGNDLQSLQKTYDTYMKMIKAQQQEHKRRMAAMSAAATADDGSAYYSTTAAAVAPAAATDDSTSASKKSKRTSSSSSSAADPTTQAAAAASSYAYSTTDANSSYYQQQNAWQNYQGYGYGTGQWAGYQNYYTQ